MVRWYALMIFDMNGLNGLVLKGLMVFLQVLSPLGSFHFGIFNH